MTTAITKENCAILSSNVYESAKSEPVPSGWVMLTNAFQHVFGTVIVAQELGLTNYMFDDLKFCQKCEE